MTYDSLSQFHTDGLSKVAFGLWGNNCQIELANESDSGFILSVNTNGIVVFQETEGERVQIGSIRY